MRRSRKNSVYSAKQATYFRASAKLFDVPPSWGRCISVVFGPDSVERIPPGRLVEPEIETHLVRGEVYYVFEASDGTIRRARMGCLPFKGYHKRPTTLPEEVEFFHYWNVDVWPPFQRGETGGASTS